MRYLTLKEIRRVARRTIEVLEEGGYRCCVFGGLGCSLWCMPYRQTNDVDIVVFGPRDPEEIKAYIVDHHHRFFLKNGKPGTPYKKLFFSLQWGRVECKVDILVSGRAALYIPKIPQQYVEYLGAHSEIPVVPLLVLLILKVQGWRHHSRSRRPDYQKKVPQNIEDINILLDTRDEYDHQCYYPWLPKWFLTRGERFVRRYTDAYPDTTYLFRELGFDV
ncbi:hypothetical protein AX14_014343 [Amanita brunnescens Koide BX004]|nr:hypothetical protein AX14_014343 [Amanita brunnescens Koide BX004]